MLHGLCGYRSYGAIAAWGRNDGTQSAQTLGLTHKTPCATTLFTILRRVDCEVCEAT